MSLKERSELTFKALEGGQLMFDYIRLWEGSRKDRSRSSLKDRSFYSLGDRSRSSLRDRSFHSLGDRSRVHLETAHRVRLLIDGSFHSLEDRSFHSLGDRSQSLFRYGFA